MFNCHYSANAVTILSVCQKQKHRLHRCVLAETDAVLRVGGDFESGGAFSLIQLNKTVASQLLQALNFFREDRVAAFLF